MQIVLKKETDSIEPIIVFLHGNSSSSSVFDSVINRLKVNSYIINLPGHGNTEHSKSPAKDYSVGNICNQLIEAFNEIDAPYFIAGNSLGGHLAIEIADSLKNLAGIILFGTPPLKKPLNIEEALHPVEILNYYFSEQVNLKEMEKAVRGTVYGNKLYPVLLDDFKKTDPKFRSAFNNSVGDLKDETLIVKNLNKPVYVIQGKQDPTVNLDYVKSLSGITKIYEIDKCGHYPSLEQPERFTEIMNEILVNDLNYEE